MSVNPDYDGDGWDWSDDDDEWDPDLTDCSWCGGDGYTECDDPIQCCRRHDDYGLCPCGACNGSGLARDQTLW